MKITNSFNNNFGALFGRKEITTHYNKDGSMEMSTIQHVHPFKDEFKTEVDKEKWLNEFKQSGFYETRNNSKYGLKKEYKVVIEPSLPFAREVFEMAKKDGIDLLFNQSDFYSVSTKNTGYCPAVIFDNGKFDCLA